MTVRRHRFAFGRESARTSDIAQGSPRRAGPDGATREGRPLGGTHVLAAAATRLGLSLRRWAPFVLLFGGTARAQGAIEGAWTMTPMTETVTVQQWSGVCGPAPTSQTVLPGGPATVMTDTGELIVATGSGVGAAATVPPARPLRTDQCIDSMPTLVREAHSADGKTWRTRCSTPAGDARHAVVNTAFFLSGDSVLTVAETGRYELHMKGTRCVADVLRQASLRRTTGATTLRGGDDAMAPTATTPPPAPAVAAAGGACVVPGDPARLEVRPSRKLLRVGDAYRFRAVVLDAYGCPTGSPVEWSLVSGAGAKAAAGLSPTVDSSGRLSVPLGAGADFRFEVVATAAGRNARAAVEVTSDENYESLLAHSGLDANGERAEPAVALMATTSLGGSGVSAEDGAHRRRLLFLAIVGGLAVALGIVALIGTLRVRKARAAERAARARHADRIREHERVKRDRQEQHAAQMRAHLESVARARAGVADTAAVPHPAARATAGSRQCPFCGREFEGEPAYCPFDAHALVPIGAAPGFTMPMAQAGGTCPTCRRGYDAGVRVCPHDGETLVPQALLAAAPPAPRGKICPTCGGRFEGNAAFCGRDGTQLVLLN